jgi:hypothetical protein
MDRINIRNCAGTQVAIDGKLYILPNQIQTILELSEYIVIQCFTPGSFSEVKRFHTDDYSLFCFSKKSNEIVWKKKDTISVRTTYLPFKKDESWFGTKEQYQKYLEEFKQEELLTINDLDYDKLVDPSNGAILGSQVTM